MSQRRVCILLMDSFGVGASLDAAQYGDEGANTFAHIHEACRLGQADKLGVRQGSLLIPHLRELGLYHVALASSGWPLINLAGSSEAKGLYGYAVEQSLGKDTPSGHWELMGLPVNFPWGYFPNEEPCFPSELIQTFIKEAKLPGVLGEKHASGISILQELGEEHIRSGKPIVYTSADSVFQIAADEETFGLKRLDEICNIARTLVDKYNVARVIARPFKKIGGEFKRTGHRKDYTSPPPGQTLLDFLQEAGREVIGIGKIADIFSQQGITQIIKAEGNEALFDATLSTLKQAPAGSLIFTNFVDFDTLYGHRRDVIGYAGALEYFDARLPELYAVLKEDDLIIIVADHGCDPTFAGTDHTREHIPILVYGPTLKAGFIGRRETFADIGQSIAHYLGINPLPYGISFL